MTTSRFIACVATAFLLVLSCDASTEEPTAKQSSVHQRQTQQQAKQATAAQTRSAVSCDDHTLSISAQEAPLADILNTVGNCTGAIVETPGDLNDKITVQLGPGPAIRVLSDLLAFTRFNYVIAGAPNDPLVIQSIQLSARPTSAETPVPAAVPEPTPTPSETAVRSDLTGGDEGVWDNVEVGTPVASGAATARDSIGTQSATAPAKPRQPGGAQQSK